MEAKPKLIFVHTKDEPSIGELAAHRGSIYFVTEEFLLADKDYIVSDINLEDTTRALPYGVVNVNEENTIREGDRYATYAVGIKDRSGPEGARKGNGWHIHTHTNSQLDKLNSLIGPKHIRKVVMQPADFDNEAIINQGLKEGDTVYRAAVGLPHPTQKPAPIYTEEEVFTLLKRALRECDSYGVILQNACGMKKYAEPEFEEQAEEWFEENKKK